MKQRAAAAAAQPEGEGGGGGKEGRIRSLGIKESGESGWGWREYSLDGALLKVEHIESIPLMERVFPCRRRRRRRCALGPAQEYSPERSAQGPAVNDRCPVELTSWLQSARQLSDEDRRTIDRGWDTRCRFPSHFNTQFEYVPSVQQRM